MYLYCYIYIYTEPRQNDTIIILWNYTLILLYIKEKKRVFLFNFFLFLRFLSAVFNLSALFKMKNASNVIFFFFTNIYKMYVETILIGLSFCSLREYLLRLMLLKYETNEKKIIHWAYIYIWKKKWLISYDVRYSDERLLIIS